MANSDSPEAQLRRFLYLNNESRAFLTGDPEFHKRFTRENLVSLDELLQADPAKVCRIVSTINSENALPRRESLFFVLAAAVTSKVPISDRYRCELYTIMLQTCKNDEEFFTFIKYVSTFKKTFSAGLNKLIARYYRNKAPLEFVKDVCKRRGYHTWTHKDLIKLSHIKTEGNDLLQVAVLYTLHGLKEAEEFSTEKEAGKELIEFAKKSIEFKATQDDDLAVKYLAENQLDLAQIPPQFKGNAKVYEALLKYIDVRNLLDLLLKLWKFNFLKHESPILTQVVEIFGNTDKVKTSNVHPIEVFIALRNFEKGGKARDPRLVTYLEEHEKQENEAKNITEYTKTNFAHVEPIKCPQIVSALNKCLMLSYQNVIATNRRFMITIEVSENMNKTCLTSKHLTAYEAAVIETLTYLKSEKHVIVAVFNGPNISLLSLDKGGSVAQALKKLKESEHGDVQMGAPIEWARNKKKAVDVFINILHTPMHKNFCIKDKPLLNPIEAYLKYKSAMNMSSTKLILHNLHQAVTTCFKESLLDIRGFDKNVPAIIDAYIKNLV